MTSVADEPDTSRLSWFAVEAQARCLAEAASEDRAPDCVVGVLRGGAIPAVLVAHLLRVRDLRTVEVTHTLHDGIDAPKSPQVRVGNPSTLGDLTGLDVLIVDDVAGTGHTVRATAALASHAGAARVRTAVCVSNQANLDPDLSRSEVPTYTALTTRGWVVFPWEAQP